MCRLLFPHVHHAIDRDLLWRLDPLRYEVFCVNFGRFDMPSILFPSVTSTLTINPANGLLVVVHLFKRRINCCYKSLASVARLVILASFELHIRCS